MSKSHNKKRNVALLYEFLVQTISRALVDNDPRRSAAALKVIKRHFRAGTELHKEFRLINALVKTTVSSESTAASIIQEAKAAARRHDTVALDREKSLLISVINRAIADDNFYDQHVNEYRMYATVQTLLNDWRTPDSDIGRIGQYEDQLLQWLVSQKPEADSVLTEETTGTGRLLMKVMMQKLNEKYSGTLSAEQKQLVRAYAFSTANDDQTSIVKKLTETRDKLLVEIDSFRQKNDEEYVNKKLDEARTMIENETFDVINDDTVTRFMLYSKLSAELMSGDK